MSIIAGVPPLTASAAPSLSSIEGASVSSTDLGFTVLAKGSGGVVSGGSVLVEGVGSVVVNCGPRCCIRVMVMLAMMRIISTSPRKRRNNRGMDLSHFFHTLHKIYTV